jgi:hypothetical protein
MNMRLLRHFSVFAGLASHVNAWVHVLVSLYMTARRTEISQIFKSR